MQLRASEKAKCDRRKSIRLLENLKVKSVLIKERFESGKKNSSRSMALTVGGCI